MRFLLNSAPNKPNRVETPEVDKDAQYHINYGRWVIGNGMVQAHSDFLHNYRVNAQFYMNKQWVLDEDTEAFFKDDNGNDRNRIKVTRNYIQPMVEQYRANAERMTFDMKLANISPMARSRREKGLAKLMIYNEVAKSMSGFGEYMKSNNMPVGNDAEIEDKYNNMYADMYVIAANRLLRYSKNVSQLEDFKTVLARDIALSGIGILKPYPHSGEWLFKRVLPDRFGWDLSATDSRLRDAEFFFEDDYVPMSTLVEMHQNITDNERKRMEEFISSLGSRATGVPIDIAVAGKIPVFTAVWRDMTVDTFGYVNDQFGQRVLKRIGYIEDGEDKPAYTMDDVIPFNDLTVYQKRVLKGGITARLYVDMWRYCKFIPVEVVSASIRDPQSKDIALEYGMVPYQESDLYKPTNMLPPYKVGTWSYMDGEVLAPVSVAINPQRMINRFLSVMENYINNSGGAGVVFDKDLIGSTPEDEIRASINKGEAIGVYAKGRGVQNIFGKYDATPKESIVAFQQLIDSFKMGIEQVTGVNEGVKGETNNPDQLVGVMQLMIQRGSIIQEPFYKAIMDIYIGAYQSIATSGKRYYIDNDVELVDAVGEEEATVLKLSKEMRNESLRVHLVRSIDNANERMTVDSTLMSFLQFGLLDQPTVAKLYGRATMEEALFAMREYQMNMAVQKRMAAQAQNQQVTQQRNAQEQAGQVVYNESIRDKVRDQLNQDADRSVQMAAINAKKS